MMNLNTLKKWLIPAWREQKELIAPGLYHYTREMDGSYTRFHLRVEPDGQGMLLANASAAARLSPAGTFMAKGLLDAWQPSEILAELTSNFKGVSYSTLQNDLNDVADLINNLATPEDNYPILNLDERSQSVFESRLFAPLEATIPLAKPEQMVPVLDRLWDIGIPHVNFLAPTGLEPAHLVRAVERAEDLGLIAGVRGRATDLRSGTLIPDLALAGVDYVRILIATTDTAVHDGLCGQGDHEQVLSLLRELPLHEVYPMAEIPLVQRTMPLLDETLGTLEEQGVSTISFFAIVALQEMTEEEGAGALLAQAMPQTADWVEEIADAADVRFLWQPAQQRDSRLTLAEQVRLGPRCSGDVAVRIEASGDVIPARGPYRSAGNILTERWESIWQNEAFVRYRERVAAPTRCVDCPGLVICSADCPREQDGWAQPGES